MSNGRPQLAASTSLLVGTIRATTRRKACWPAAHATFDDATWIEVLSIARKYYGRRRSN